MQNAPEAFELLSLPDAILSSATGATESGTISLDCVTMPNPESTNSQDRDVYLILRLNASEIVIDPIRVLKRTDAPAFRTYTFVGTQADPTDLVLQLKVPAPQGPDPQLQEKMDTFENILEQYVAEFHGPNPPMPEPSVVPVVPGQTAGLGVTSGNKDLRGHLVMINEDTGEVVGEVEDRFRIREDPVMHERGHENDPVIIEVPEDTSSLRESDANTLEAFASLIPPDQQNWVTKSASIVSHAISLTTTLLVTTITSASNYYITHSEQSPHHSTAGTPTGSGSKSPAPGQKGAGQPPPLPPRALVFLTSEKTRKGLSTVHTISGEAVKISTKTVKTIDSLIRRAMGAKTKRTKYFPHGVPATGPSGVSNLNLLKPSGPPLPARSRSPSPSPSARSSFAPPPYLAGQYTPGAEKSTSYFSSEKGAPPALPPRRSTSPMPPSLPPRVGPSSAVTPGVDWQTAPQVQPKWSTKDRILISADLILSTIDDSTRKLLDTGTVEIGKVMGHKYGPEAAQSSLLMAGTARNVGLVYVDMRGIGRRALLKRTARTFVKARIASNNPNPNQPIQSPSPIGKQ